MTPRPARHPYSTLVDTPYDPEARRHRIVVPEGAAVGDVAEAVHTVFLTTPACSVLSLEAGDRPLASVGRERFERRMGGPTKPWRGTGDGDGASLAGAANRYEVYAYDCATCGSSAYELEADRPVPECDTEGDGAMVRRT
ncbi:hypothetical protein [Streptomyces sp. NPDC058653]|uniref:hypothetical protein n=1 Tax=Streptomyces sp. NPDC058653 TaxID=3346576 RepID=UPI0036543FE3